MPAINDLYLPMIPHVLIPCRKNPNESQPAQDPLRELDPSPNNLAINT
jgi:hypothetical protein